MFREHNQTSTSIMHKESQNIFFAYVQYIEPARCWRNSLCMFFFTIAPTLVSPYTKDASLIPRLSVSNRMWIPCEEYYPVATIVHMYKLFRPIQTPAESRTSYKLQGQQGNLMSLCEWFRLSKDPHLADLRLHTFHEPAHCSRFY